MDSWQLTAEDLKGYPHFDSFISAEDAVALATSPNRVATHKFFPFLLYEQRFNRFAEKGEEGKEKIRPIRYAARRDAYIFSYYRHILSDLYEKELTILGLENNVLAYRRIPTINGKGNRCNIHHCHEAILRIRSLRNCCAIALDISSYFESLDHEKLKTHWCRLLGVTRLPSDHFQVYKAITKYSFVNKLDAYERLGYYGFAPAHDNTSKLYKKYLVSFEKIPRQLCSASDFRLKIAGGNGDRSAIQTRSEPYGIPQGAPLSDLLANLYLIDFDKKISRQVREQGGYYYRYSDDILVLMPGCEKKGIETMEYVQDEIRAHGAELIIQKQKSSLLLFTTNNNGQECQLLHGKQGKNGLEYLGFRFDGKNIFLRDSTLSGLMRKITYSIKKHVREHTRRYPTKTLCELEAVIDCERIVKLFGRVEGFFELGSDFRKWTFWSYAKKAMKEFGPLGNRIEHQLRRHRIIIQKRISKQLESATYKRNLRTDL